MVRITFIVSIILSCLLLSFSGAHSQSTDFKLINPLEIAPTLSGNFGELRPNHFHGGLDLKTAAREGLRVLSAANGYVSRIKISPYGYGKAVYITHPSGYTTVYGHLSMLSDSIQRYAHRIQYEQESFSIDVYPGKEDLIVKQGQVIALSGNTGGSGGPHLHFEIRETETEVPRNPLLFDFPIQDHKKPVIEAIAVAPLSERTSVMGSSTTRHFRYASGTIATNGKLTVSGPFGVEIRGYDQQDGSSNQNGIYKITGYLDGEQFAMFVADSISFDRSRHLNALIDYDYYYLKHQRFMRLYKLPGNLLENVTYLNNGRLTPNPGPHQIKIVAEDVHGNTSTVQFEVEVKATDNRAVASQEIIQWDKDFYFESANYQIHIPSGAIYQDVIQQINEQPDRIEILRPQIPLQKSFVIKIRSADTDKNLIARLNREGKPVRALQTRQEGDWLVAESRSFGIFGLSTDSKKPVIKSVNFTRGSTLKYAEVVFQIQDNFSGIESFRVNINEKWVLAEFDPKRSRLSIARKEIKRSTEMQDLKVVVTDMAGNVATFEGSFLNP